eukprot:3938146-Rhodomonas_salina.1
MLGNGRTARTLSGRRMSARQSNNTRMAHDASATGIAERTCGAADSDVAAASAAGSADLACELGDGVRVARDLHSASQSPTS